MKRMRNKISMLLTLVLLLTTVVPVHAASQGPCWTKNAEEWTYDNGAGTQLTAKIVDKTLYIKGTGAVPAYSRDCLGNRPWHTRSIQSIIIEDGITAIGAEAFSNMKELNSVSMSASVFIEDTSAFAGAAQGCYITVRGMNIQSRYIGKIPYTSLDSIAALIVKYNGNYWFKLNNYYMIGLAQNSAGTKLYQVVPADVSGKDTNAQYPLINYASTLTAANSYGQNIGSLTITSRQQGEQALEAFSLVMGDYEYVAAYNVGVSGVSGSSKTTTQPVQYTMTIPAAYQYPGRQFALIQLGQGVINILEDEDSQDGTMTFTTNYPSTVYALIYRDNLAVPQIP